MVCEIMPGIWLGNEGDMNNLRFLTSKNISCIINVTKDIQHNKDYSGEKIRIPVDYPIRNSSTKINTVMFDYLNDVTEFIKKKNNGFDSVLVICADGEQSSATVICAYLVRYGKVTADLSIKYLVSKASNAFKEGVYFYWALKKFENFHKRNK